LFLSERPSRLFPAKRKIFLSLASAFRWLSFCRARSVLPLSKVMNFLRVHTLPHFFSACFLFGGWACPLKAGLFFPCDVLVSRSVPLWVLVLRFFSLLEFSSLVPPVSEAFALDRRGMLFGHHGRFHDFKPADFYPSHLRFATFFADLFRLWMSWRILAPPSGGRPLPPFQYNVAPSMRIRHPHFW